MNRKLDLYISIGNTRTSFAVLEKLSNNMQVIKKDTKTFFHNMQFDQVLSILNINIKRIFVCSVVKSVNEKIILFFKNKEIIFLTSSTQNIIKLNLLDNVDEIGNDIIASAIYANSLNKNTIIASLGTATVISSVIDGSLNGCIIFPGLETAYNALIENTMIEKNELSPINKKIGTNTQDALSIGIIKGHQVMIKELSKPFSAPNTLHIYFGGNTSYIELKGWKQIEDMDLWGLYLFSLSR